MSDDPVIAEVLAVQQGEIDALLRRDRVHFADALSPSLVVNTPMHVIGRREDTLRLYDIGVIEYSSFDRRIEHASRFADGVVTMGQEAICPKNGPNAGKIITRRFTDVWRQEDGAWKLALRQATVISVEERAGT